MDTSDVYMPMNPKSIAGILDKRNDTKTLSNLIAKIKLNGQPIGKTLDSMGEYTVFAPTNSAFKKAVMKLKKMNLLPKGDLMKMLDDSAVNDTLAKVLSYHVLATKVTSNMISDGATPKTINGKNLCITILTNKVFINGRAEVKQVDIQANNGVIHIIDEVLIPLDNCTPNEQLLKGGNKRLLKKEPKENKKSRMS